jgi:hypothetical protein
MVLRCSVALLPRPPTPLLVQRFQPMIVPKGGSPCSAQPLDVKPFWGGGLAAASASASSWANSGAAKARVADACAQAFGGKCSA